MNYQLVLSNFEIVEFQVLVTVDNDVTYHVTLVDFQICP